MRYSILTRAQVPRRLFDPKNKKDLLELKYFVTNGKWKDGCPFFLEEPWENVPIMCKDRYAAHMLQKLK